jgi:Cytochrome c554 and c-prime
VAKRAQATSRHVDRLLLGAVLLLGGLVGAGIVLHARPMPADAAYTGSKRCTTCHLREADRWVVSQHQKMMRPADEPGVVVASFGAEEHRFERAQAVWAIGGKWEQQFMGEDATGETLLPGAWLVGSRHWQMVGWDGWQKPVPLKRCHGCHTVGLNVETGKFVEPNIGCESCHGPGSWHVRTLGLGRIHSSADGEVCGQCHTRGTTPSGEFDFPVGYRPGGDLAQFFVELDASPGQTSSQWWGNGHPRKRHQEYAAWRQGGHANSLRDLREGYDGRYGAVTEACLGCHAGDYILGGRFKPGVDEAAQPITCAVCHHVHGNLAEVRMDCGDCHRGGAFYHHPERNATHVACPKQAKVGCVGCHMPFTVENGGGYTLHSHAPGVISPAEAAQYDMPSSCANGGCHADVAPAVLQAWFAAHYANEPTHWDAARVTAGPQAPSTGWPKDARGGLAAPCCPSPPL